MSKFLFLFVGVIVISKSNGIPISSKPSLSPDDSNEVFNIDDWNEMDATYPGDTNREIPEKRLSRDSLMRRSTLDKNFMRFGRSGFFPAERCCKQKDLVGLVESYDSVSDPITLTKRGTDSNFMRFGRSVADNFMRFGRGGDDFMRFGRPEKDKGNFMRFGRGGDNFMRFGRDKSNFMRFGRGKDDTFMRFGRGDKDSFIRFGRAQDPDDTDDEAEDAFSRLGKSDNFLRFGKNPVNFIRYGKSGGQDDSFIRFGKSGRNATYFVRFGRELRNDPNNEDGTKTNLTTRRKRMIAGEEFHRERIARNPELMESVLSETRRSAKDDTITKPDLLKFISLINSYHPNRDGNDVKPFFPSQRNPVLKPNSETYKRRQDGNGFIRFG